MLTSSKHHKISRSSVKITALLVLFMGGFAGVSCRDGGDGGGGNPAAQTTNTPTPTSTPMREPGQRGTKPPASTPVARRITNTSDPYQAMPTPCDKTRQVQVELTKFGVNCTNYNFTSLNDEAQRLADAQLNLVQCPATGPCTLRNAFYTYWTALCKNGTATVQIKGYAVCATANTNPDWINKGISPPTDRSKSTDKITPAPVTMSPGENPTFGPDDNENHIKGENNQGAAAAGTTLACPSTNLYVFTYKESDPQASSTGVGDYGPVINRAIYQAVILYNQYSCSGTCTKQPFIPVFTKWYLEDKKYVVVEVYFTVACK